MCSFMHAQLHLCVIDIRLKDFVCTLTKPELLVSASVAQTRIAGSLLSPWDNWLSRFVDHCSAAIVD